MATMNLSICDLCKLVSKDGLPFRFTLQKKGKKGAANIKAEICQVCFDDFSSRIESEISFEQLNKSATKPPRQMKSVDGLRMIQDNIAVVPSAMDYDTAYNRSGQSKCGHEKTSFDPPYIKCKECGDQWEA